MAWIILIIAGLLEVVWALTLKSSEGFSKLTPTLVFLAALAASMLLLAKASRTLPIGTAYGVWVGIGALGAALGGLVFFGESFSPIRIFFLALLLVAIIGLKLSTP